MTVSTTIKASFMIERLEHDITKDDFIFVSFPRTGGRTNGQFTMKLADGLNARKLLHALQNQGAKFDMNAVPIAEVTDLLARVPDAVGILTDTTGWKGEAPNRCFVLPDQIFGEPIERVVMSEKAKFNCLASGAAGTLESWQELVAVPALSSGIAATVLLASFSGPLFPFSKLTEGMIFNLAGNGSSGKSSANKGAASVWGEPSKASSWNGSERGISEAAAANNGICLILDDAEQASPDPKKRLARVNELTHVLTAGRGKAYASMVSGPEQLPSLEFDCVALSSSPSSIERDASFRGQPRTDGDRARLLEIDVPHGDIGGIWKPYLAGEPPKNTAARSDALSSAAKYNYGAAGRAYLQYLVAHQNELEKMVAKHTARFRRRAAYDVTSVQGRIADKVGLLYAAGRIAAKAKVLPWGKADIFAIAKFAYQSFLDAGCAVAINAVSAALSLESRFKQQSLYPHVKADKLTQSTLPDDVEGCYHKAGGKLYVRLEKLGPALAEGQNTAVKETDIKSVLQLFRDCGALLKGHSGGATQDVRIGQGKTKFLVFDEIKLAAFFKAGKPIS